MTRASLITFPFSNSRSQTKASVSSNGKNHSLPINSESKIQLADFRENIFPAALSAFVAFPSAVCLLAYSTTSVSELPIDQSRVINQSLYSLRKTPSHQNCLQMAAGPQGYPKWLLNCKQNIGDSKVMDLILRKIYISSIV